MTTNGIFSGGVTPLPDLDQSERDLAALEADAADPENFDQNGDVAAMPNIDTHGMFRLGREDLLRKRTALQNQVATLEQVMEPMARTEVGRGQMPQHWPLELKRMQDEIENIDAALSQPANWDMRDDLDALRRANNVTDETLSNLTPEDYADLRDYLPPPSPVRPQRERIRERLDGIRDRLDHSRATAAIADELRGMGADVRVIGGSPIRPWPGFRRRYRHPTLVQRLTRWAAEFMIERLENMLDDLYDVKHDLSADADDVSTCARPPMPFGPFDPGADPAAWTTGGDSLVDSDYPELTSDGHGLGRGVFKGGIGGL